MPAYTNISNALVSVGAKPFATTIQALRDNPLAIAEGDPTAVALGLTIKDDAMDQGAPNANGLSWVARRIAGQSFGAVGTFGFFRVVGATSLGYGNGVGGSALLPAGIIGNPATQEIRSGGSAMSGTWICLGFINPAVGQIGVTLFVRIA